MKTYRSAWMGLVAGGVLVFALTALAGSGNTQRPGKRSTGLVEVVEQAAGQFSDPAAAEAAGYEPVNGCVSGPQEGAMGLHFVKGELVGDGQLDPAQPEALIYEPRNKRLELVGVEFLVLAEGWHAQNEGPPVLMGHLMHYVSSPNRYGLPAFYELHVWPWRQNPNGTFADWNPRVSCAAYAPDELPSASAAGHSHGLVSR